MILDSLGMFDAAASLPEQLSRSLESSARVLEGCALPAHEDIANIVLLGSGASGLAASLVLEATGPTIPVPIVVHRGYGVPNFVDESTLVVAISLDGETAETLEAAQDAHADGAAVVCVSRGGSLEAWASMHGLAHLPVTTEVLVERAAIPSLVVPVLLVLEHVGMYPGGRAWIEAAMTQVSARRDELIGEDNQARRLARRLGRCLPIVYGGNGPGGVAAEFWKSQFNQNAKVASFSNRVPDLTHDEIAGWGQDGDVTRQVFQAILLRHDYEHPQVAARMEAVEEVLVEVVGAVHVVTAAGEGLLAQILDLELLGLFVSLHAAVEQAVDPGPVPVIDEIATRVGEV